MRSAAPIPARWPATSRSAALRLTPRSGSGSSSVSRERALLVCVDNVHAADDDSASFLLTLGRESRASQLFVLTTLRTGGNVGASEAIRILRERAQRLRLPGLDAHACELLANGLVRWSGQRRPGRRTCSAAAAAAFHGNSSSSRSSWCRRRSREYEAGSWVLPLDVAEDELPARSEEILTARLSELGADAVALAQAPRRPRGRRAAGAVALAVERPVRRGSHLRRPRRTARRSRCWCSGGDGYRFRHEALREAVLSRMDPDACARRAACARPRRCSRSRRAASPSASRQRSTSSTPETRTVGTRILVAAAREFAAGAGTHQNADQLVRALCRMVRAYDQDRALGLRARRAVLFPLMPLAYYSANWQFILEYGERAIEHRHADHRPAGARRSSPPSSARKKR